MAQANLSTMRSRSSRLSIVPKTDVTIVSSSAPFVKAGFWPERTNSREAASRPGTGGRDGASTMMSGGGPARSGPALQNPMLRASAPGTLIRVEVEKANAGPLVGTGHQPRGGPLHGRCVVSRDFLHVGRISCQRGGSADCAGGHCSSKGKSTPRVLNSGHVALRVVKRRLVDLLSDLIHKRCLVRTADNLHRNVERLKLAGCTR